MVPRLHGVLVALFARDVAPTQISFGVAFKLKTLGADSASRRGRQRTATTARGKPFGIPRSLSTLKEIQRLRYTPRCRMPFEQTMARPPSSLPNRPAWPQACSGSQFRSS